MELVGPFEESIFKSSWAANIAERAAKAKLRLIPAVWFSVLLLDCYNICVAKFQCFCFLTTVLHFYYLHLSRICTSWPSVNDQWGLLAIVYCFKLLIANPGPCMFERNMVTGVGP